MKITVVTPSYNQLRWLKLCAASVADQQGAAFEHIIQDAKSGKELEDWVQTHSNAQLFVEEDSGMYDAINRGFRRAAGDIVAWLNCDEQYLPGALARVAAFFEQNPQVDVLFGDAVLLSKDGELLSYRRAILPTFLHIQLSHLNTLSCATFVRRSVIERGLFLETEWKAIADAVWVAAMLKAKLRMAVLHEPLAAFTMTEENLGQSSLAFKEGERWQRQTTASWMRALRSPVILLHRIRKFLNGAYEVRNFSTEIYTQSSCAKRVPVKSEALTFTWMRSQSHTFGRTVSDLLKAAGELFKPQGAPSTHVALPFSFYYPPRWHLLELLIFPVMLAVGVLGVERAMTNDIVVAPMLSTILMLILSFWLEPLQLLPFATAFIVAIFYSLHSASDFQPGILSDWITIGVRMFGFSIASILAMLSSRYRCEAKLQQNKTLAILISLPMPVVISDALGALIFVNDEAADFLQISRECLRRYNYIQLLMGHEDEGVAMRNYIKLFQSLPEAHANAMGGRVQTLSSATTDGKLHPVEGRLIFFGQAQARNMVTVLMPSAFKYDASLKACFQSLLENPLSREAEVRDIPANGANTPCKPEAASAVAGKTKVKIYGFGACMISGYPLQEGNSFFHQAITRVNAATAMEVEPFIFTMGGFPINRAQKYLQPKVLSQAPDVVIFQFGSTDACVRVGKFFGRKSSGDDAGLSFDPIKWRERCKWTVMGIVGDLFRIPPTTPSDAYLQTFERMVLAACAQNAIPVVLSPFVIGGFRSDRFARRYNSELKAKIASIPGAHYVDAYEELNVLPRHQVVLQDGSHLSPTGHEIVGLALTECLLKILKAQVELKSTPSGNAE